MFFDEIKPYRAGSFIRNLRVVWRGVVFFFTGRRKYFPGPQSSTAFWTMYLYGDRLTLDYCKEFKTGAVVVLVGMKLLLEA